ncbi:MAG: hypothetical protein ACR2NN_07845 [Bryobacteraceae bacterium]
MDFGATEPGTSVMQTLTLSNPSSASVTIGSIAVTGSGFSSPVGISAPLVLPPNQSIPFTITFAPTGTQTSTGTLAIDQRSFKLTGLGVNPPLPKAAIQFDTQAGISARQARVSIQLSSTSRVGGTGTLTMDFYSMIGGVTDDPAIQFLSGPKRNATVTINAGESIARFGHSSGLRLSDGNHRRRHCVHPQTAEWHAADHLLDTRGGALLRYCRGHPARERSGREPGWVRQYLFRLAVGVHLLRQERPGAAARSDPCR